MKITFTASEIIHFLDMSSACVNELKMFSKDAEMVRNKLRQASEDIRYLEKSPDNKKASDVQKRLFDKTNDGNVKIYIHGDGCVTMDINEDTIISSLIIVSESVPVLAGMAITMVGLMKTFGSSLKTMATKIKKVIWRNK